MKQSELITAALKGDATLVVKNARVVNVFTNEILEGDVAPNATVMSWRGESGGIKSARMGHDVVMTPGNYMYFDFYQADPKTQI